MLQYVWLPLLPRDEMICEGFFLGMVDILEAMGIIDTSETNAKRFLDFLKM